MPLHVWLPEAHPAAPSHVSALMSGVMIKMGIYGLLRALTFLGPPSAWWGWMLIGVGLTSGVLGVLFALAQHDLKRLLAYHSVENIGIIALGLGVGLVGVSNGSPVLAVLGFGGGLLHVVEPRVCSKGCCSSARARCCTARGRWRLIISAALAKRMPWTAATFLVGAVAISGLPPLNGFVSEFLIYLGAFNGGHATRRGGRAAVGGDCRAGADRRAGGGLFHESIRDRVSRRTAHRDAAHAHEAGAAMRWPMMLLAAACVAIGLCAPLMVRPLAGVLPSVSRLSAESVAENLANAEGSLRWVVIGSAAFLALVAGVGVVAPAVAGGADGH